MNKSLTRAIRYSVAFLLLLSVIDIIVLEDFKRIKEPYSFDEYLYKNVTNNFNVEYIKYLYYNTLETKPLSFLTLQKVLNNADPTYTRGLNLILIIISTFLIYKITSNKFAFLYILIPIFLDSMWLTAEIIEVTFVLLSIRYATNSGLFVGLATIFRPTALLYSVLLKRRQILYVLGIGFIFALILFEVGLFWAYWYEVTHYVQTIFIEPDIFVLISFILLAIIGLNRQMLGYIIISAIPLGMKLYPHYFLPVYTFLFIGFLLNMNEDFSK